MFRLTSCMLYIYSFLPQSFHFGSVDPPFNSIGYGYIYLLCAYDNNLDTSYIGRTYRYSRCIQGTLSTTPCPKFPQPIIIPAMRDGSS